MLFDVLKHLDRHDAFYDLADAVVIVRLKTTRDMYLEELDRLRNLSVWSSPQAEDYDELTKDVKALARVMDLYGFDEENDDD